MQLPEDDVTYLNGKGYNWELFPDGREGCLVIRDFPVVPARFDRSSTDLLLRIPEGYNNSQLDMFYVDPAVRLLSGAFPVAADQFVTFAGRQWQRFSRHLGSWRPGLDGIEVMLTFAQRELQR
jgi:hypothetical protein